LSKGHSVRGIDSGSDEDEGPHMNFCRAVEAIRTIRQLLKDYDKANPLENLLRRSSDSEDSEEKNPWYTQGGPLGGAKNAKQL